jgi:hypothetical protein
MQAASLGVYDELWIRQAEGFPCKHSGLAWSIRLEKSQFTLMREYNPAAVPNIPTVHPAMYNPTSTLSARFPENVKEGDVAYQSTRVTEEREGTQGAGRPVRS